MKAESNHEHRNGRKRSISNGRSRQNFGRRRNVHTADTRADDARRRADAILSGDRPRLSLGGRWDGYRLGRLPTADEQAAGWDGRDLDRDEP